MFQRFVAFRPHGLLLLAVLSGFSFHMLCYRVSTAFIILFHHFVINYIAYSR